MVQSWKASYEGNYLVGENAVDVPRWVCSEFFQETRLSKKRFKNRYTSPQNIEVDSDSESDITPEEEQEEPEQEEVTAADDLSMLDRKSVV